MLEENIIHWAIKMFYYWLFNIYKATEFLCFPLETTSRSLTSWRSGMSTVSLTTWWPRSWSPLEDLFGLARIMMEMCSQTFWLRVSRLRLDNEYVCRAPNVALVGRDVHVFVISCWCDFLLIPCFCLYQALVLWVSWHQCLCVPTVKPSRLRPHMALSPGTTVNTR